MADTSWYQAASNRVLGGIGRAIDVAGRTANAVGIKPKDYNISEKLELKGSEGLSTEQKVQERISQGKPIAGADTETARKMGATFTYDPNIGIKGDKPAFNQQEQASGTEKFATGGKLTSGETAALGLDQGQLWGGNEITINGQKYRVKDNGDGTRSFEPISSGGDEKRPTFNFQEGLDKAGGADLVGQYLDQGQADEILRKYSEGAFGRADDLAAEIERVARENAEREYNDVLSALGDQRKEVDTLGAQQKQRAMTEKELTEAELQARQESESKDIEKQRAGFVESTEEEKDRLGRAWRDMSLEVQRIMRGRGIADSSFASGEELSVLKDFNAGLRQLAVKKTSALKDFADAATETVQFYNRKKVQLAEEVRQRVEDVDNWVRQQVTSIQNQQNKALSKKLADINNAILQGRQLKTDIANQVAQTELNFGMWLKQTEINYKLAVAEAAKGKVSSAQDTIAKAAALSKNMFTLLENGQAQWVQGEDGTMGLQDSMTGTVIPVRPGYKDEYEQLQQEKETLKSYTDNLVLSQLKGLNLNNQQDEEQQSGGLLGSINRFLSK